MFHKPALLLRATAEYTDDNRFPSWIFLASTCGFHGSLLLRSVTIPNQKLLMFISDCFLKSVCYPHIHLYSIENIGLQSLAMSIIDCIFSPRNLASLPPPPPPNHIVSLYQILECKFIETGTCTMSLEQGLVLWLVLYKVPGTLMELYSGANLDCTVTAHIHLTWVPGKDAGKRRHTFYFELDLQLFVIV